MEPLSIVAAASAAYIYNQVGALLTETALGSIALNIVSNKIDTYGAKQYKKFIERIDEPTNHDIQKAVRRSYLKALLLAVEHEKKQGSWISKRSPLDNKTESYIKKQIRDLEKKNTAFPPTDFDEQYQHLFRAQKDTAEATLQSMIDMLKDSVLNELRDQGIDVSVNLESYIRLGWKEEVKSKGGKNTSHKSVDWYKLVCAFFVEELKTNDRVSNVIQAEYLDNTSQDIQSWKAHLEGLHLEYKGQIDVCNEILEILTDIHQKVTELPEHIRAIPEHIRAILIEESQKHPSIENMKVDGHYQQLQKEIEKFIKKEQEIKSEIEDLKAELADETDPEKQERKKRILNRAEISFIEINGQKNEKEKELETFIKDVISLAQYFDANTIETPRFIQARELFEAGKYKEAGNVLNEKEIYEDIKQAKEKLGDYAQELVLKAKITVVNKEMPDWYEQADRLFKDAVEAFESYDPLFAYAHFLHEHNQYIQAIPLYEKCEVLATDDVKKANILNNLGILQANTNRFKEAEECYQEALKIRMELSESNPQTYFADVAVTLNNLGLLHAKANRSEEAEKSYAEALEIYRKLAESNPQTYLAYVALTLNNLGNLQVNTNRSKEAEESYNEALGIRRKLAELNPQTYFADVAMTLNNLGVLYVSNNRLKEAEESFNESLEIYRKLAESNPQAYLSYVAGTLNNLGNLQANTNRSKEAEKSYTEALEMYRKLAESNPQTYLSDVALLLNNLGVLYVSANRLKEAEESNTEALEIYRKLAELNPQVYLALVAITLNNLGILQKNTDRPEEAEENYSEALDIYRKLGESHPQTYLADVSITLNNLGNLQADTDRPEEAKKNYNEALKIRRKLAELNPQKFKIQYAGTALNLALLYKNQIPDKTKSIFYAREALNACLPFADIVPHAAKQKKTAEDILKYWEQQ